MRALAYGHAHGGLAGVDYQRQKPAEQELGAPCGGPVQLGSRSIWGRIRMWFTRRREIKVSGWGLPATRMVNFRSYEISSTNRSRHRAPLAIRCT